MIASSSEKEPHSFHQCGCCKSLGTKLGKHIRRCPNEELQSSRCRDHFHVLRQGRLLKAGDLIKGPFTSEHTQGQVPGGRQQSPHLLGFLGVPSLANDHHILVICRLQRLGGWNHKVGRQGIGSFHLSRIPCNQLVKPQAEASFVIPYIFWGNQHFHGSINRQV